MRETLTHLSIEGITLSDTFLPSTTFLSCQLINVSVSINDEYYKHTNNIAIYVYRDIICTLILFVISKLFDVIYPSRFDTEVLKCQNTVRANSISIYVYIDILFVCSVVLHFVTLAARPPPVCNKNIVDGKII